MIPTTAEIVVVGAGVLGASIAFHLTRKGARDVLLVDRAGVCSGETAKSGGFVQTHWTGLGEVRLIHRAREMFHHWADVVGGDCGFLQTGYLHVTGPEREDAVRSVHQMLVEEGIESHWLDVPEVKRLQPLLKVDDLVGGAYEPQSGWADPVATTRSLAEAARTGGATIIEGVTVLQLSHRAGKITGVETTEGHISTPTVVLAVGPWTNLLHPDPRVHLPIQARRGQVCYMTRPGGLPRHEIAFYDEVTGLYTHTDGDEQLVGLDWNFDDVWGPDHYRREVDLDYVQAAHQALSFRFPSLRLSQPVRGLVGLYDFTPDGYPILDGPLGLEGYYVAAGFSGAGFKSAPMTGLGLAELVLEGRASSVDIDFLRLSRFQDHPYG